MAASLSAPAAAQTSMRELELPAAYAPLTSAEWIGAPALTLGSVAVRFLGPSHPPNWDGGILFDESLYLSVAPHRQKTWRTIANISHAGFASAMAYRLIDDLLIVGAAYDSWEVATQMLGMDLEAFTIIAATLWLPQLFVRRQRPIVGLCGDPEYAQNKCDENPERYRSFWAGHPAAATAAAGMTCVHHQRLKIYGDPIADGAACGVMIGLAAMTGVTRAIAGYHWPSDVLIGFAVGTLAWVLPTAIHYGFGRETATANPVTRN